MIKGSINQEHEMIVNNYAPNFRALKYIMQILTEVKVEINSNTIIIGDFNTPLLTIDRSSRESIRKQ